MADIQVGQICPRASLAALVKQKQKGNVSHLTVKSDVFFDSIIGRVLFSFGGKKKMAQPWPRRHKEKSEKKKENGNGKGRRVLETSR